MKEIYTYQNVIDSMNFLKMSEMANYLNEVIKKNAGTSSDVPAAFIPVHDPDLDSIWFLHANLPVNSIPFCPLCEI